MPENELKAALRSLHDELSRAGTMDTETVESLRDLTQEIQAFLDERRLPEREQLDSIMDRMRETLLRFETQHPQIAGIVTRIVDGLGNLGI